MKLITNSSDSNHISIINKLFKNSEKISIAVAFLKESGLNEFVNSLVDYLKSGKQITIICGLDFGLTEPKALIKLYDLSRKFKGLQILTHSVDKTQATFHPKAFLSSREKDADILIGSANLTAGGLKHNEECSLFITVNKTNAVYKEIVEYFVALLKTAKNCTLLSILQYQVFFEKQKKARKEIAEKPDSDFDFFDYNNLAEWLSIYRETNDINGVFEAKSQHYDDAKVVLDRIADVEGLTRAQFIPLLERLVGSKTEDALWHSGSIYRKKTMVFDHAGAFQRLVRFIRGQRDGKPSVVFNGAMDLVSNIEGSGVNTVTEIMMTYNREKFANLNKNPITVLRQEGGVALKAHRNSFTGDDYETYCKLVSEISDFLGLRNMLESDSFFNDIYWQLD